MFDDNSTHLQTFVFIIYSLSRRTIVGEAEERMIRIGTNGIPDKDEMMEFSGDLLEMIDADDIEEHWKKFGEHWITHRASTLDAGRVEVRVFSKKIVVD